MILGYWIKLSCLYIPQGHHFISTLWLCADEYIFIFFEQNPPLKAGNLKNMAVNKLKQLKLEHVCGDDLLSFTDHNNHLSVMTSFFQITNNLKLPSFFRSIITTTCRGIYHLWEIPSLLSVNLRKPQ